MSDFTIMAIMLAILTVMVLPCWGYSRHWGFIPAGITSACALVSIIAKMVL